MSEMNTESLPEASSEPESRPGGIPLYVWVLIAVALAIPVGIYWQEGADSLNILPKLIIRASRRWPPRWSSWRSFMRSSSNDIRGRQGVRMMLYYLVNTLVAMGIGLAITNLVKPGLGRGSRSDLGRGVEVLAEEDRRPTCSPR